MTKRGKVGSDPKAARQVGGKGDFGAPEKNVTEREYASHETRHNDPGGAPTRIKTGEGQRVSGVGANVGGVGSGSGGDIDTDIVGLGNAAPMSPKAERSRPGTKRRRETVHGSTVDHSGGDVTTTGEGAGAGSVTNPEARNDDAFAGEVSDDEASGAQSS